MPDFFMLRRRWIVAMLIALSIVGLWWLMATSRSGLVPQEDMGTISLNVQVAPGSNLAETEAVMDRIEDSIRNIPQISIYSRVTGKGDDINSVIKEIHRRTASITSAQIRTPRRRRWPPSGRRWSFIGLTVCRHIGLNT